MKKSVILTSLSTLLFTVMFQSAAFGGEALINALPADTTKELQQKIDKVKTNPNDYAAIFALAEAYENASNFDTANMLYKHLLNIASEDARIAKFLLKKEDERLLLNPTSAIDYYSKGLLYTNLNMLDEAFSNIKKACDLERSNPEYLYMLGIFYEFSGEHDKAEAIYQILKKENPDVRGYRLALARNYIAMNRFDDAIYEYRGAQSLGSGEQFAEEMKNTVALNDFMKKHHFKTMDELLDYAKSGKNKIVIPAPVRVLAQRFSDYNFKNSDIKLTFDNGVKVITVTPHTDLANGLYTLATSGNNNPKNIVSFESGQNSKYILVDPFYASKVPGPGKTVLAKHVLNTEAVAGNKNINDNNIKNVSDVKQNNESVFENNDKKPDNNVIQKENNNVVPTEDRKPAYKFENLKSEGDNRISETATIVSSGRVDVFTRADELAAEKKYLEAVNVMRSTGSEEFPVIFKTGLLYAEAKHFDEAEMYLKKANALQPENIDVLRSLANVFFEKNDYDSAGECLNKILKYSPDDKQAVELKRKIAKILLNDEISQAVTLINKSDYENALPILERLQRALPDEFIVYYYIGHIKYATKDYKSACQNFEKAIQLNPDYSLLYYSAGLAYDKLEQYDKSLAAYKKFVSGSDGDNKYAQYAKSRISIISGKN